MDAQIRALGSNNVPPTNEVQQEVRQRLANTLQELQDLESEIINVENYLKELKTKRHATKRTIHQYRSILSPQRWMLPEVLGEIFYRCLPTHPIITTMECPLLLTHVCSSWRAVAISEPRLWARIHTAFSDRDMSNDMIPQTLADQRSIRTPHGQRKLYMMKKWLSLSGITPLSISISFSPTQLRSNFRYEASPLPSTIIKIFQFLAQLSPRFEDLELKLPFGVYRVLEGIIDAQTMTRLTSLTVEICPGSGASFLYTIGMLRAPNLKKIAISTDGISLTWGITNPSHMSAWRRLTDISCSTSLPPAQLILLLAHAPNLIRFKATVNELHQVLLGFVGGPSAGAEYVPSAPGYISLPFLRILSIKDCLGRHDTYDRINAPELTWVEYIRPHQEAPSEDRIDQSIVSLLQRSPKLKKLTIDLQDWGEVGRFWEAIPSITHLVLGCEERSPSGSLVRKISRGSSRHLDERESLPLHDFNIAPSGSANPILPNLESLEISSPHTPVRDEDIISLIISRLNHPPLSLSSPARADPGIARLKHVGVVFYREKERDIAAEILKYAKRDGTDTIDLVLDYPIADEYIPEAWPPSWAR